MLDSPLKHAFVIVGERRLSREALRRLLDGTSFRVAAHGETLPEALAGRASETKPDLVVFLVGDGVEGTLPQIRHARATYGAKTVVLTDCDDPDAMIKLVNSDTDAILSRDISPEMLEDALGLVMLGQHLFPAGIARLLRKPAEARGVPGFPAPAQPVAEPGITLRRGVLLSARERQILGCLVNGLPNKVIARELEITEATVKVHVKGLLRKTGMTNRTQAAIWAMNQAPAKELASAGMELAYADPQA